MLAKLQPYVLCLDHAVRVFEIADAFRLNPTSVQASVDPKDCLASVPLTKMLPPLAPEIDTKGDAYVFALANLFAVTSALQPSVPSSNHQAQLAAAFEIFDAAHASLFDHVVKLNRAVHLDQLQRREAKYGLTLAIRAEHAVLDAEALVRHAGIRADQVDKIDVATLEAELASYEQSLEAMIAHSMRETKEAEGVQEGWWPFLERGRAYATAVRELLIRTRGRVAFTDGEKIMLAANNEENVVGSPAAAVTAYNRFLDHYRPSKQP